MIYSFYKNSYIQSPELDAIPFYFIILHNTLLAYKNLIHENVEYNGKYLKLLL